MLGVILKKIGNKLEVLLAIIGILITVGIPVYQHRTKNKRSWKKVLKDVDLLVKNINEQRFEYDCIVSFPGGGLIIAELIGYRQSKKYPIISVDILNSMDNGILKELSVNSDDIKKKAFKNRRILLVDDVTRTGSSLATVVEYLISHAGVERDQIFVATLGKLKGIQGFNVDYKGFEYEGEYYFPWGVTYSD